MEALPVRKSYLEGKMTKRPFAAKGNRSKEVLELVHSNLCGPMNIQVRGGFEYFITFIDNYSSLNALRNSEHLRQKRKSIMVNVSRHYDLIVVASTS